MAEPYTGTDVNTVLAVVDRITKDGDTQLSIMAHALVISCKSTQVARNVAMAEINKLWDRPDLLVPLPITQ